MKKNILIIDDEAYILESLSAILAERYTVFKAQSPISGLELIKDHNIDCIILDINMPAISGLDLLKQIKQAYPEIVIIMVTAVKEVDTIIKAIKLGAYHYIVKPYEVEELLVILENALEHSELRDEVEYLRSELDKLYDRHIIGNSPLIKKVIEKIDQIADKNVTVLIQGSSGTGKELVARAIHYRGKRKEKPFVAINCGAIPHNLIENELFGHEKGAFTGASDLKKGKFEIARDGIVFLDEIGSLDYEMQKKLLRVIEERSFNRIGGVKTISAEAQIISATAVDLEKAITVGRFREDLYYRLNVFPIRLPDLRERREDIPMLVDYFISKFKEKYNSPLARVSENVKQVLVDYKWPGNIRQLENLIERIVLLARKPVLDIADLPEDFYGKIEPQKADTLHFTPDLTMDQVEARYIKFVLKKKNYNLSSAAKQLEMTRKTLRTKIKKFNITIDKPHKKRDGKMKNPVEKKSN